MAALRAQGVGRGASRADGIATGWLLGSRQYSAALGTASARRDGLVVSPVGCADVPVVAGGIQTLQRAGRACELADLGRRCGVSVSALAWSAFPLSMFPLSASRTTDVCQRVAVSESRRHAVGPSRHSREGMGLVSRKA